MINPILASSALRRMRSMKTHIILALSLASLFVLSCLTLGSLLQPSIYVSSLTSGAASYQMLIVLQFVLILLIAPALTAARYENRALGAALRALGHPQADELAEWLENTDLGGH